MMELPFIEIIWLQYFYQGGKNNLPVKEHCGLLGWKYLYISEREAITPGSKNWVDSVFQRCGIIYLQGEGSFSAKNTFLVEAVSFHWERSGPWPSCLGLDGCELAIKAALLLWTIQWEAFGCAAGSLGEGPANEEKGELPERSRKIIKRAAGTLLEAGAPKRTPPWETSDGGDAHKLLGTFISVPDVKVEVFSDL